MLIRKLRKFQDGGGERVRRMQIPPFGGSFCKFKGEAPFALPNDPDFRVQRPKKPIIEHISYSQP